MKKVLSICIKLFIFIGIIYYLYAVLGIRVYKASGTSMNSTIGNGEIVLTIKEKNIKRGDIIVFDVSGSNIIKRIVGLPTETIDIKENGSVYINNALYNENYVSTKTPKEEISYPHTIEDNSYFVLGDNRVDSFDSRFKKIKDINIKKIKGRVFFSLSKLKLVHRINQ